jgi:hypothetical protein
MIALAGFLGSWLSPDRGGSAWRSACQNKPFPVKPFEQVFGSMNGLVKESLDHAKFPSFPRRMQVFQNGDEPAAAVFILVLVVNLAELANRLYGAPPRKEEGVCHG